MPVVSRIGCVVPGAMWLAFVSSVIWPFFFERERALYPVGYLYGFHTIDKIFRDK